MVTETWAVQSGKASKLRLIPLHQVHVCFCEFRGMRKSCSTLCTTHSMTVSFVNRFMITANPSLLPSTRRRPQLKENLLPSLAADLQTLPVLTIPSLLLLKKLPGFPLFQPQGSPTLVQKTFCCRLREPFNKAEHPCDTLSFG